MSICHRELEGKFKFPSTKKFGDLEWTWNTLIDKKEIDFYCSGKRTIIEKDHFWERLGRLLSSSQLSLRLIK